MSARVLLRPRYCAWHSVEGCGSQLHRLLQWRGACQTTSERTENEWTLDLDTDPEEASHAPQEEAHQPHSPKYHKSTTQDNRLLFSIGKKLMTADQFAKKAAINNPSVGSEFDDLGSVGDGWWEEEGEGEVQREEGKVGRSEGGDVGEGRGFQSMKVMRKYLRGKGKAGSRLALQPPETTELIQCLDRNLRPNWRRLEPFMTIPSMLGSGVRAMEAKVDMLKRLGFSKREIEIILLEFSSILEVDYRNVYDVYTVLKKCISGGHILRGLLMRHPFLFLQPAEQIEERVTVLKNVCRDRNALGFLLHNYPILLFASLTPSTLHTITKFTTSKHHTLPEDGAQCKIGHGWVAKSLYHNLSMLPARLEPGPDVSALINLLGEFQLEPTSIFVKFPGFFKAKSSHVVSLLEVLAGSPLYLDTVSIRTLLTSIPDQLVWSEDAEQLETHLCTLTSLFTSAKECSEKVVLYPGLVLPQLDLKRWMVGLEALGFTGEQTALLVSGTPNILLQNREDEFMPRLRFLLTLPGTTPSDIVACPINSRVSIFNTPLHILRVRLNYSLQHKPDMVCGQHLANIFATQDREFASFCGRSVEQLHSETGLTGIELKKLKTSKTPPRNQDLVDAARLQGTTTARSSSSEEKTVKAETLKRSGTPSRSESISGSKDSVSSSRIPTSAVSKKKSQEKKVASSKVRKKPPLPSDTHTGGTSTSSKSAYGSKPLKTDKVSKANFGRTMQEKKSYVKKLREQA